ncbi:MAG: hypothetical protein WBA76_21435 [Phormidesmis sp.]
MKPISLLTYQPLALGKTLGRTSSETGPDSPVVMPQLVPIGQSPKESDRHILLGSTGAVHQTIHLLHALGYTETLLWSPLVMVEEPLTITPAQGEAMSLLRKQI